MLALLLALEVTGLRQEYANPPNVSTESVTFVAPEANTTTTPIPYEIPMTSTINVTKVTVNVTTSQEISNKTATTFPSCDQLPACNAIIPPPSEDEDPTKQLIAQLQKQVGGITR